MSDLDGDCDDCLGKGMRCLSCGEPMSIDQSECGICGSVEAEPCERCMNAKEDSGG